MSSVSTESRSASLDALRGVAIITMLAANLAGPCLREPHPLWFRIIGSVAAPTFVSLAGVVGSGRIGKALRRSAELLLVGAGIDLLFWRIAPFRTFDVLYLLGFALPLVALCKRLPVRAHWCIALGVLLATPLLQSQLGYALQFSQSPVWKRLLIDGWFPLFPWLGVALLGGAVGRMADQNRGLTRGGPMLVALGALAWWLCPPPALVTREGYSELFYPPTLQFLGIALGTVALLLVGLRALEQRMSVEGLALLGRSSLLIYIGHEALIAFLFQARWPNQPLSMFAAMYLGLLAAMFGLAFAARNWRRARAERRR